MKRKYRERKYYCGEYLEISIYPVYTQPKKRGKRSKPTTEIQQRLNKQHTEGRLRRLLNTNFTSSDIFVTLTFDDDHLPSTVEECQRHFQNFLRRTKRHYGKKGIDPKYIYALEYGHKHNRLHIHLVITGGISRDSLMKLWGHGSVSSDALQFNKDGLAALAKYLTKGSDSDKRPTWKRWSGSRNLEQPTITQRDGLLSHRKMVSLCNDGGDTNYLEPLADGYEVVDFSPDITQDIYGGYYLAAILKKIPTRIIPWSETVCLPFG